MGFLQIFLKKITCGQEVKGQLLAQRLIFSRSAPSWCTPFKPDCLLRPLVRMPKLSEGPLDPQDHNSLLHPENRTMQGDVQASRADLPTCLSPDLQAFRAGFIPCAHSVLGLSCWCQKREWWEPSGMTAFVLCSLAHQKLNSETAIKMPFWAIVPRSTANHPQQ